MTYKALFLDIDGTILMPDHTYTDLTKEAISRAKEQGIEVFLSTGRPAHEIDELAEALAIDSVIGYNGAYATYHGEVLVNEPMDAETVNAFLDISKTQGNDAVLYMKGKNLFTTLDDPKIKQFIDFFQLQHNDKYNETYNQDILGMTLLKMDDIELDPFKINPNIHLSPVHLEGIEHSYDLIRQTVNKGQAVKVLLDKLQISKEQAIAFGDGMNDKEMLQAVGHGFAMENAHPDLFNYATYRTTTVHESGIYHGLKTLGLI